MGLAQLTSDMREALQPIGKSLLPVAVISGVLNILMLGGSFFMLLVYDEVLPSRSLPTLAGLLLIVACVYAFQAFLDFVRGRIMVQLGSLFARRISMRVLDVLSRFELTAGPLASGTQPVRDLDQVRSFLSGPGPLAILDLPWVLLFLAILFLFHWSLGVLALLGVLVMIALMVITDRLTQRRTEEIVQLGSQRFNSAEAVRRNAETLRALGMGRSRRDSWATLESRYLAANDGLARFAGSMSSTTRSFRMMLQSSVLALGAYLVIDGQATGGVIIAGSIISARALAPVEQTIAQWKGAINSLQAFKRLRMMFAEVPEAHPPMALPVPKNSLDVQALTCGPPGRRLITIAEITFSLEAGDGLAVVGRSGSGKSTLARAICGIWPALRGHVRLDGASLDQWSPDDLGAALGYLPQSVELFDGTIAQNIARFDPTARPEDILAAAHAADIHEMVTRFEGGYEYLVGPGGGSLSAGQMQRVALARALYKNPFLIVLDEPNSNLDGAGEIALGQAIEGARQRGAIVIVIAHRPNILTHVSHVLIMNNGRLQEFGKRDEVKLGTRQLSTPPGKIASQ